MHDHWVTHGEQPADDADPNLYPLPLNAYGKKSAPLPEGDHVVAQSNVKGDVADEGGVESSHDAGGCSSPIPAEDLVADIFQSSSTRGGNRTGTSQHCSTDGSTSTDGCRGNLLPMHSGSPVVDAAARSVGVCGEQTAKDAAGNETEGNTEVSHDGAAANVTTLSDLFDS